MRILIATFGSRYDKQALRLGTEMASLGSELPTVLAVIQQVEDRPPSRAEAILAHLDGLLKPVGLGVRTWARPGYPAKQIIHEAQEGDYDLIIVGDGLDGNLLQRLLSGSPVARVAKAAPCSVLVVKGHVRPIRRILLCDSGAGNPLTDLPLAGSPSTTPGTGTTNRSVLSRFTALLADLFSGEEEVTVLHVMSQMSAGPGIRGTQLRAGIEGLIETDAPEGKLLEQDTQALNRPGIHPHPEVRHGLVVDEILAEAQRGDYDLVVIGAYSGEGWRRILLDDQAHRIMAQLDRPVLVVR